MRTLAQQPVRQVAFLQDYRKLKQAFTVDCFDDIVLCVPLLARTASWCSSGFPNINVLLK